MLFDKLLAFIDVETSGGNAQRDRIIEIGIIISDGFKIIEEYSTLIHPGVAISSFIQNYTGITDADVVDAPYFDEVAGKIFELLNDKIFVAHNVHFDYGFLRHELRRAGYSFSARKLCTVRLSRQLYPEYKKHNLDIIMERNGLNCEHRHRALDDTRLMYQFFQICFASFGKETAKKVCNALMLKPNTPINVSQDVLDSLPETYGVYQLYGKENEMLYIGKSKNMQKRILSHFSQASYTERSQKLSQEVYRIETIQTAGELGALLVESQYLKKHQPLYNTRLRKHSQMVMLKKRINEDGYPEIYLEEGTVTHEELSCIYGVFRTKQQANDIMRSLSAEYRLCDVLLGVQEKSETKKLREPARKYSKRFEEAFASLRIQNWPYHGVLAIKEKCAFRGVEAVHLFHEWMYLGVASQEYEVAEIIQNYSQSTFDYDVYRILHSYTKKYADSMQFQIISDNDIEMQG
jgi:DNA polymerase-3 subunit epsilon